MKKLLSIWIIIATCSFCAEAQDYKTALGLRGGPSYGITLKHFIKEKLALEGIVTSRWKGANITILAEVHAPAFKVEGLNWYYGGGGHIGFWRGHDKHPWFNDKNERHSVVGLDGIIGLEYVIKQIPFVVSIDWKPVFNFWERQGFLGDEAAVSFRYTFGRNK